MKKSDFCLLIIMIALEAILVLAVMAAIGWLILGWAMFSAAWSTMISCPLPIFVLSLFVVLVLVDIWVVSADVGKKKSKKK